ncbi:hypothetical protein [Shewanella waksmanii]|uniref:hypothetical protein n=1 Tax=Shewanella waksmanii TaxID=213783 RepID=UPI0037362894
MDSSTHHLAAIASGCNEQAQATNELTHNLAQIEEVSDQVVAISQQLAQGAQSLSQLTNELSRDCDKFTLAEDELSTTEKRSR